MIDGKGDGRGMLRTLFAERRIAIRTNPRVSQMRPLSSIIGLWLMLWLSQTGSVPQ